MRWVGRFYVLVAGSALVILSSTACSTQQADLQDTPRASFMAAPTYGTGPLAVTFSDKSTGEIDSWTWDFDGDGVVDSVEQNPTFVYTESGMYTISLVVDGPDGQDTNIKSYYIDLD